jgi:hypothetical protein
VLLVQVHVVVFSIVFDKPAKIKNLSQLFKDEECITLKPVLRGHLWEKRKSGLIRQVTS